MPSKSAKLSAKSTSPRTVVFVVYPHIKLLDLTGPLQVFSDARCDYAKPAYRVVVASLNAESIQTDTCIALDCESLSDWHHRRIDTLIVVGGRGVFSALNNTRLTSSIARLAKKSRRVGSVCSGAFLLAASASGLLDGRRATTHWESVSKLATDFPDIKVDENPIYIRDQNVWTSAGVTAGIDMALAMLSEDHGRAAALSLARTLVTFLIRPGGQSQFSETLELQAKDSGAKFDSLHQWIQANLGRELRVEHLANQVNMSPRNFSRIYAMETGRTPAKAVEFIRVEAARRLLEEGKLSMRAVARHCGFKDGERMRRSFIRTVKVAPSHYLKSVNADSGHN